MSKKKKRMKKISKVIKKPRIFLYIGIPSFLGWTGFCLWALFDKEHVKYESLFELILCVPFIVGFLFLCLASINWRIIVEKDTVTVRNIFRMKKTYNISDIRVINKDPDKKGAIKFYLFYGEKKIATVSEFDDNFDLVTKIKVDLTKWA